MGRKKTQLQKLQQLLEQQLTAAAVTERELSRFEQATRSRFKQRMAIAWKAMPKVQPEAVDATADEAFERLTISMAVIHRAGKAGTANMELMMDTMVSLFEEYAGVVAPTQTSTPGIPEACHCPPWAVALDDALKQYDPMSDPVLLLEFLYGTEIVIYEIMLLQFIWRCVTATVETTRSCIARAKQQLRGEQVAPRTLPVHPFLQLLHVIIDVIVFAVVSGMKTASVVAVLCQAAYQEVLQLKKKIKTTVAEAASQPIEALKEEGGEENDAIDARAARMCGVAQWIACNASDASSSEESEPQALSPTTILVTTSTAAP